MATTSIEISLSSLLPTLNSTLPSELVHLATSLLAQSRTHINLKPNEEIARSYACAEIACKRLQSRLKLPGTHGRPPLPPKVYAKLLDLLEKGLHVRQKPTRAKVDNDGGGGAGKNMTGSGSSPVKGMLSTPRKRKRVAVEVDTTPSKTVTATSAAVTTTPGKKVAFTGKVSVRKTAGAGVDNEAPEWVMPFIRRLCAAFKTPALPPHVYTGACVVLRLAELWQGSDFDQEDEIRSTVSAMTLAVYFMVWTKMQQGKITPEVYVARCEEAIKVATEMGLNDVDKDDVDIWIKRMNDRGWCRGQDWWDSVPQNVIDVVDPDTGDGRNDLDEQDDVVGSKRRRRRLIEDDETDDDKEGVLLPGLGTMMQDAVDFLSEERTLDYQEWKMGILENIRHMEKGKGTIVSVR